MQKGPALPDVDELIALARTQGIEMGTDEAEAYRRMLRGFIASCRHVEGLAEGTPSPKYPRPAPYRPARADNPYNAWQWCSEIKGAPDGPLAGVRVGVKDFINVAGLPSLLGSEEREFVPDTDAAAVELLLDAGATVLGKTTAADGAGDDDIGGNSRYATVRNPRKAGYAPGGSSNGSAAALAAGDIDLALGTDQGGSIRIPASWCGVVGLRPTFGLVPYTGVMGADHTMSAVGPLANTVEMIARAMNVLAKVDPRDPRQRGITPPAVNYRTAIGHDVRGLRIAVVREGFGQSPWEDLGFPGSDPAVDAAVRKTLAELQDRGAVVDEVSIPAHIDAVHVFHAMYNEGNAAVSQANGVGTSFWGWYDLKMMEGIGRARWSDPNAMSPAQKSSLIFAEYLRRRYHGRYYALSQNVRASVRAGYDNVLARYDVVALPTIPFLATPIPPSDLPPDKRVAFAMQMIGNTCQMGATGHPAISVPCGEVDGLPVGLQFIGKHMDDWTLIKAADIVERHVGTGRR